MLGFLIAVAAGFLTPHIEGPLATPLARALEATVPVGVNEYRLLAFMIGLLIAAIIAGILGSGSTFGLLIGAILGYFGSRIVAAIRVQMR